MIVGASGATGGTVSEALGQEGSRLALVGRDRARLATLAEHLGRYDLDVATLIFDLEGPTQPEACVRQAEARLRRIDVLAVCSGNPRTRGARLGDRHLRFGRVRLICNYEARGTAPGARRVADRV